MKKRSINTKAGQDRARKVMFATNHFIKEKNYSKEHIKNYFITRYQFTEDMGKSYMNEVFENFKRVGIEEAFEVKNYQADFKKASTLSENSSE